MANSNLPRRIIKVSFPILCSILRSVSPLSFILGNSNLKSEEGTDGLYTSAELGRIFDSLYDLISSSSS
uniref:AT1G16890 protein n=1 Tax=Arabidopsis thaliana TaxID=3702 RepID=C0Z273_ARATH|nr:AT1G16890 [Arabidopsis thaliana]